MTGTAIDLSCLLKGYSNRSRRIGSKDSGSQIHSSLGFVVGLGLLGNKLGSVEGSPDRTKDGDSLKTIEGELLGLSDEGVSKGKELGLTEGEADGELLGLAKGNALGMAEGNDDGEALGDTEGNELGPADGLAEGDVDVELLGLAEGDALGLAEGDVVDGELLGLAEGDVVGDFEGGAMIVTVAALVVREF